MTRCLDCLNYFWSTKVLKFSFESQQLRKKAIVKPKMPVLKKQRPDLCCDNAIDLKQGCQGQEKVREFC